MKKILVALDGSEREAGVLAAALELGKRTDAKVLLFRAVGIPKDIPIEAFTTAPDDLARLLEKQANADLDRLAKAAPSGLVIGTRVLLGTPWSAIEQAAKEADVDLIVIGAHGYGTLDRLIGTTASKVVNHADRPVLVVRSPERLTTA